MPRGISTAAEIDRALNGPSRTDAEIDAHNARVYESMYRSRGTHIAVLYAVIIGAIVWHFVKL